MKAGFAGYRSEGAPVGLGWVRTREEERQWGTVGWVPVTSRQHKTGSSSSRIVPPGAVQTRGSSCPVPSLQPLS